MSKLKQILNREPIFINPYTDFGFKRLFGEIGNKDLLIDFLNQLLPTHHQIADLNFINPENLPELEFERKAFFDISCVSASGEEFIVEMQKAKVRNFKDRSLFYTTFPIKRQAKQGEWDFSLNTIYFIGILDFEYDEKGTTKKVLREVALRDQDGELFSDKLHFKYIQMPVFNKNSDELNSRFEKWLYFLKNLENFEEIPQILNETVFQKGFEIAKIAKMKHQDFTTYEKERLAYWENKAVMDTAREDAKNEGRELGRELGREEVLSEIINSCYADGMSIQSIAKIVKKPIEYVQSVIDKK